MSIKNFIAYLQQLLSMIDPDNDYSVALAKSALTATVALVEASGKVDGMTRRTMRAALHAFNSLAEHAEDFAGTPGMYKENEQKRQRLEMMLYPHC